MKRSSASRHDGQLELTLKSMRKRIERHDAHGLGSANEYSVPTGSKSAVCLNSGIDKHASIEAVAAINAVTAEGACE